MSQTTYYEFNKPEGTDLVNPLVDTNPNWDKLDNDLHEFNERSIANCTEVVTLGVHAISRLDTTSKFLKWIATANFTAGETFTVDGLVVAASTPAGAALATGAYVTGSVVLACLNADNSAMTIFVSGTNVATDSERLGGELPSYYGTAADVADNAADITNLQNQVGNTSIVGIGDGTATGAISALNNEVNKGSYSKTYGGQNITYGSMFNEFATHIDFSKVNLKSKVRINALVYSVLNYSTDFIIVSCSTLDINEGTEIIQANISTNNPYYLIALANRNVNQTNTDIPSNTTVTIEY